jgi:DNA polymerase elongation subunit (family B)
MAYLHGKVVHCDEVLKGGKFLPNRDHFIDPGQKEAIENTLRHGNKTLFLPTTVHEYTGSSIRENERGMSYRLGFTGILRDGTKQTVVLSGIYPHFEVRIPEFIDGKPVEDLYWDGGKIQTKRQIEKKFPRFADFPADDERFPKFEKIQTKRQFDEVVRNILDNLQTEYNDVKKDFIIHDAEDVKAKPFLGFTENPCTWRRYIFKTSKQRLAALKAFQEAGFETATDDSSRSYAWVAARNAGISMCTWCTLENYEIRYTSEYADSSEYVNSYQTGGASPKNERLIFLDVADFKPYEEELEVDLIREKTISCCWDIETFSETKTSEVPLPHRDEDRIFCIGMTFQFAMAKDHLFKVAICDVPAKPNPDFLTIVCGHEHNILKVFIEVLDCINPDFIVGFNDSDYDWPWLANRIDEHGLFEIFYKKMAIMKPNYVETSINKDKETRAKRRKKAEEKGKEYLFENSYLFKQFFERAKRQVKIDPTISADCRIVNFDSFIPIDVRVMLRKIYKSDEQSSLKWFLAKFKLGSKYDMPYRKMFHIYQCLVKQEARKKVGKKNCGRCKKNNPHILTREIEDPEEFNCAKDDPCLVDLEYGMSEINMYCVQDAACCHKLLSVRNIIPDSREFGGLVHCTLFDTIYRADSAKVFNKTVAIAQKPPFNLLLTTNKHTAHTKDKFPGAYVHPPEKGMQTTKLSLNERWHKANPTKHEKATDVPDKKLVGKNWSIKKCKKLIRRYGVCLTQSEIDRIQESHEEQFPPALIKFWREKIGRPIFGADFASLYPSLIRAYNFSAEYCFLDEEKAKDYATRTDSKLTEVNFTYGSKTIQAWFVWHENKTDPEDPNFKFGVYGYILDTLFCRRAAIKKRMKALNKIIEQVESGQLEEPDNFDFIKVQAAYLDSKQGALKVFMNTFYGTAGSTTSPLFMVEVSGGVTQYGQINIKLAKKFVEEQGFHVYYGDTDSLYLSAPEKAFLEVDLDYYAGSLSKEEYWTKLVEITFKQAEELLAGVNGMFVKESGTNFLKMAYEEVLFPSIFAAKKKYYGTPHEGLVNFNARPFVKGFETKKRGTTDLLKTVFNHIIHVSLSPGNLKTIEELVLDAIEQVYNNKWDYKDFIATAVFRPSKQNPSVRRFVERMKERGKKVAPNDRFNYVVVKKYPFKYDYRGRKTALSVGDRWEYPEYAEENKLQIDLDHYMKGSVLGQLARLMSYHERFERMVDPRLPLEEREIKIYGLAKKWVEAHSKQYFSKYNQFGKVLQSAFRQVKSTIESNFRERDAFGCTLLTANIRGDKAFEKSGFVDQVEKLSEKEAAKCASGYGKAVISILSKSFGSRKKTIDKAFKIYLGGRKGKNNKSCSGLYDDQMRVLEDRRAKIMRKLYEEAEKSLEHITEYQESLGKALSVTHKIIEVNGAELKEGEEAKNFTAGEVNLGGFLNEAEDNAVIVTETFLEERKETLDRMREVYLELLACDIEILRLRDIIDAMKDLSGGDSGPKRPKTMVSCRNMVREEREATPAASLEALDI